MAAEYFRSALEGVRTLFQNCCGMLTSTQKNTFYLLGFINRPTGNKPSPNIEMSREMVSNPHAVTIICLEMGEICLGNGYVAELLRFPPDESRLHWTLSYAVWNDTTPTHLLWRKFFANVVAFFYAIDATDRKLMKIIKKELNEFMTMSRPIKFPEFLVLIFLNNTKEPNAMKANEVDEFLKIEHPDCLGYLIEPMRGRATFRSALEWLIDQLLKHGVETVGLYPDQITRERNISGMSSTSSPDQYPTFNLKPFDMDDADGEEGQKQKSGASGSLPPITPPPTDPTPPAGITKRRTLPSEEGKLVTFNTRRESFRGD